MSAQPFPAYMTTAAVLVALSGILMYANDSAGFNGAWIATPTGIVVFTVIGMAIFRYV